MQMNTQERFLIKMNRIITYSIIIGLCFFISYISVNGTNAIAQRNSVGNISYKLPDTWNAVESEKQFRLLEITLNTNEDDVSGGLSYDGQRLLIYKIEKGLMFNN